MLVFSSVIFSEAPLMLSIISLMMTAADWMTSTPSDVAFVLSVSTLDFLDAVRGLNGKLADLVGDDGESPAVVPGPGRLDRGVKGEKVEPCPLCR